MTPYRDISQKRIYLQILDQIKEKIRNGELKAGDRLPPERQWAEQLGVSRATVREAIRSLEIFGLINCKQGEGNFVSNDMGMALTQPLSIMFWLNEGKIADIHEFRMALELQSAYSAAVNGSDEDVEILEEIYQQIVSAPNEVEASVFDKAFHDTIGRMGGNCLLRDTLSSAASLMEVFIREARTAIIAQEKDAAVINMQHRNILNGIAAHDGNAAHRAMLEHMLYIQDFIAEIAKNRDGKKIKNM